jgi:uncharacterized membrane protein YfcA
MKLIRWMLSGSIVSALVLTALLDASIRLEIWLGMLGPLVAAIASWIAMERQRSRNPQGLTKLMIKAFAAKMVFFAGYIIVLLGVGWVRPFSFVISFLGYYISLHVMEAIGLRHFQADPLSDSSGALQRPLR